MDVTDCAPSRTEMKEAHVKALRASWRPIANSGDVAEETDSLWLLKTMGILTGSGQREGFPAPMGKKQTTVHSMASGMASPTPWVWDCRRYGRGAAAMSSYCTTTNAELGQGRLHSGLLIC